jgi:flagellar biosynthesis/type III secretory pathway protein FliH
MSDFVPMRDKGSFSVGLMGEGSSRAESEPDSPSPEPNLGEDESDRVALPSSVEELEELMTAVREDARQAAEAVLQDTRQALEADRAALQELCERIDSSRTSWALEVRNVLGELVMAGVRQVVSESAQLQEEMLRDRFAEVGERLIGEQEVMIRVRPEDEEAAQALLGGRDGWTVVPDKAVSAGVVAETESGKVDATMGAALAGLADSVQEWQAEGVSEE